MDEKSRSWLYQQLQSWADMEQLDSSLYRRMIRDCIKKERYDDDDFDPE